jgi:hypothetical protein
MSSYDPVRPHFHFGFFDFGFRIVIHRITLSALAKTFGGIVTPIAWRF